MAKYTYDELTPILPGKPSRGRGVSQQPSLNQDIEVWPTNDSQEKPSKDKTGQKSSSRSSTQEVPLDKKRKGKGEGGEKRKDGQEEERTTLTDTEKVIEESDATARGVLQDIYKEAERKARKMLGKAGSQAGLSLQVFKPLIKSQLNWLRLLKQKVKFFADKVGKKVKKTGSYLMYPWKPQSQVGIVAKGPLNKPQEGYIYMIFAFDTSGSITQPELESIVTELNSVARIFKSNKLSGKVFALEWDTKVHQFEEYKPSAEIKVYGGGGTEPRAIFRFIDSKIKSKEQNEPYLLQLGTKDTTWVKKIPGSKYTTAPFLVIFTDGMFNTPLTKADLGKIYGISENNILYILTEESGVSNIYPKDNYIIYDKPKF